MYSQYLGNADMLRCNEVTPWAGLLEYCSHRNPLTLQPTMKCLGEVSWTLDNAINTRNHFREVVHAVLQSEFAFVMANA